MLCWPLIHYLLSYVNRVSVDNLIMHCFFIEIAYQDFNYCSRQLRAKSVSKNGTFYI